MANYFDKNTDKGIVAFQDELDPQKRKEIFVLKIRPAFLKLIENTVFVYNFKSIENIEILQGDCESYLFECLFKFKSDKGCSFSYFNQICKNWFLQEVKLRKKRIQQDIPISRELLEQSEDGKKFIICPFEDELIGAEFSILLKQEMNSWVFKIKNKQERKVLSAVIELFNKIDDISLLNKKSIYVFLRSMTGFNTKQVALNLIKLRKRYASFKKKFHDGKF